VKSSARVIRVLAALALILVGPALVIIPSYKASGRLRGQFPRLERALATALDELNQRELSCREEPGRSGRLELARLWKVHRELVSADHRLGMAAFSVHDWEVTEAMRWRLPATRGMKVLEEVERELADTADFEMRHPICRWVEYANMDELREEERRSSAEVAAYRAQLEPFVPRLAEARAALERDHPRLGAIAWSLGVIEVVGWALFLVVLRQELRAWRKRRNARDGTQA
jgi:hypothetical protein